MIDFAKAFDDLYVVSSRRTLIPGRLGIKTGASTYTIDVPGRPGYVYVSLGANGKSGQATAKDAVGVEAVGFQNVWMRRENGQLVIREADHSTGGGGGSTTLVGLSDVAFTGLADGDLLAYDAASGDWVNLVPAGGSGDAPSPHALSSGHHSGTLADAQAPQFLMMDGSRNLTGNLTVVGGVTIDGVDISAHAVNPAAHHNPVTVGNTGLSLSTQVVSLNLATDPGLEISSGLRVKAYHGILRDSSGVSVKLKTTSGLEVDANGLALANSVAGNGLGVTNKVLSVNVSNGLEINTDNVRVNQAFAFTWTGQHQFNVDPQINASLDFIGTERTITSAAGTSLNINPGGDLVLNPVGQDVLPGGSILVDLGDYNRKWRTLFAAELYVETLVAQDVLATIGGRIMVAPTTTLIADVSAGATTIDVKHNNLTNGSFVMLQTAPGGIAQFEVMKTTSVHTVITGGYRYSVTRNLDGTGVTGWLAGDAVVNLGRVAGEGYIDLTSTSTIHNHFGPTITIYARSGTALWTDTKAVVSMGNLESFVDYSTPEFGFAVGNDLTLSPATGFSGLTADRAAGIRLFNTDLQFYESGVLAISLTRNDGLRLLQDSVLDSNPNRYIEWYSDLEPITLANRKGLISSYQNSGRSHMDIFALGSVQHAELQIGAQGNSQDAYLKFKSLTETIEINAAVTTTEGALTVGGALHATGAFSTTAAAVIGTTLSVVGTFSAGDRGSITRQAAFDTIIASSLLDNLYLRDGSAAVPGVGVYGPSIGFGPVADTGTRRRASIAAVQTAADVDLMGLAFFVHPSPTGTDVLEEAMRVGGNANLFVRIGGGGNAASSLHVYENSSQIDASAGITVQQGGSGDSVLHWVIGATVFSAGIDNSDDNWKLSIGYTLGTNNVMVVDTATGVVTIPGISTGGGGGAHDPATAGDGIFLIGQEISVNATVVRTTRAISAGAGLTGGGDLSADRTLAVSLGTNPALSTASGLVVLLGANPGLTTTGGLAVSLNATTPGLSTVGGLGVDSTVARTTVDMIAGAGLTGGGTLAASRTFNVVALSTGGLQVNADSIQIKLDSPSGLITDATGLRILDAFAGDGLVMAAKIMAVGAGNGISVAADSVAVVALSTGGLTVGGTGVAVLLPANSGLQKDATGLWIYRRGNLGLNSGISLTAIDGIYLADSMAGSGLAWNAADERILNVGAGNGITVAVDSVAVNQAFAFSWTGAHSHAALSTFNAGATFAAGVFTFDTDPQVGADLDFIGGARTITTAASDLLTIAPGGDLVLYPTGADVLPGGSILVDLGDYNRKWRTLFAAELYVETLVAQDVLATIGGRVMVAPTTTLIADMSSGATTISVKHNNLTNGSYIMMQAAPGGIAQIEVMKTTSTHTVITGGYRYNVTRNLDGTGANNWVAGDAVVNLGGTVGQGYIDLTSTSTVHNHLGPTITIYSRTGTLAWTDTKAVVSMGNLESFVDYSTAEFGFAVGNDLTLTPAGGFSGLTADRADGLRLFNTEINLYSGATKIIKLDQTAGLVLDFDIAEGATSNLGIRWRDDVDVGSGALARVSGSHTGANVSLGLFALSPAGNASISLAVQREDLSRDSRLLITDTLFEGNVGDVGNFRFENTNRFLFGGDVATVIASTLHVSENTADVGATAGLTVEQDGAGDAVVQLLLTGGQRWVIGIDNSASGDPLKIAANADVGTAPLLTLTTAGVLTTAAGIVAGGAVTASGAISGTTITASGVLSTAVGATVGTTLTLTGGRADITRTTVFGLAADVATSDNIYLRDTGGTAALDAYGASIGFGRVGTSSTSRRAAIAAVQVGADSDQVGLAFFVHPSATSTDPLVEAFRLTTNSAQIIYGGNELNFVANAGANGDLPAGAKVSASVDIGFSAASAGTAGSRLVFAAYNGTAWRSMFETANVATGEPVAVLAKSGGNVGIGTLTPGTDIVGTYDYASTVRILQLNGAQARAILRGSTDAGLDLIDTGSGANLKWMQLYNDAGVTKFRAVSDTGTVTEDDMLALDHATGFVGFGTATPGVDIVGTFDFSSGVYHVVQIDNASKDTHLVLRGGSGANFDLIHPGASANLRWFQFKTLSGSTNFYANDDAGAVAKRFLTLDHATGYVGLNQSAPGGWLDIGAEGSGIPAVRSTVYGAAAYQFIGRRALTSKASPSAITSGSVVTTIGALGYTSGGWSAAVNGEISFVATENFDTGVSGKGGTELNFWIRANGAGAVSKALTINQDSVLQGFNVYPKAVGGTNRVMYVDSTGVIGTLGSSLRTKEAVRDVPGDYLEKLALGLRPIFYKAKDDANRDDQLGFIAEEVDALGAKELVHYDERGRVEGLAYERFIVPAIGMVQRLWAKVHELSGQVEQLQRRLAA